MKSVYKLTHTLSPASTLTSVVGWKAHLHSAPQPALYNFKPTTSYIQFGIACILHISSPTIPTPFPHTLSKIHKLIKLLLWCFAVQKNDDEHIRRPATESGGCADRLAAVLYRIPFWASIQPPHPARQNECVYFSQQHWLLIKVNFILKIEYPVGDFFILFLYISIFFVLFWENSINQEEFILFYVPCTHRTSGEKYSVDGNTTTEMLLKNNPFVEYPI